MSRAVDPCFRGVSRAYDSGSKLLNFHSACVVGTSPKQLSQIPEELATGLLSGSCYGDCYDDDMKKMIMMTLTVLLVTRTSCFCYYCYC